MSDITASKNDRKKSLVYRDDATLSPTELAAKAALIKKIAERKAARADAYNKVLAYVKANGDAEIKAIARVLEPMRAERGTVVRDTEQNRLLRLFGVPAGSEANRADCAGFIGTKVSGLVAYKELHKGDTEMARSIVTAIKSGDPANRVWVSYDPEGGDGFGEYTLAGLGADAPEGWKGYLPVAGEASAQ